MNSAQLREKHGFGYLLGVDSNPKTVKGQKRGYLTAIMYLAPASVAGFNVCPLAELAGCIAGCLNTAGHGGMAKAGATIAPFGVPVPANNVQRARIARTRFYVEHRAAFFLQLEREISRFIKRAAKRELIPVVRLNGTSDIIWEKQKAVFSTGENCTIFERFPTLQFYDYTKIAKRFERPQPANYYLCLSYSGASPVYAARCEKAARDYNASLVIVVRDDIIKRDILDNDVTALDGDDTDLRFLDFEGAKVILKAKGTAKKDTSGFVVDYYQNGV